LSTKTSQKKKTAVKHENEDITEKKPAGGKADPTFSQMGLTQLEDIAEGYEAVINNNVDGVPVVSKKPITPFTTALKMLRAQQRSTVSTNVGTSYTN